MDKDTSKTSYGQNGQLQSIVTILDGVNNPTPKGYASLGELFDRMRTNDSGKRAKVLELRQTALRAKKSGDESGYKNQKESLRGFLLGEWSYRSDAPEHCNSYLSILVLDFDYSFFYEGDAPPWTPEICRETFAKVCADPYTLAAFFSPSGGLRVMVDAVSTLEIHSETYGEVMEYYSRLTELPILKSKKIEGKKIANAPFGIDPICKNISRFFFFVEGLTEDEFYLNESSRQFILDRAGKGTKGEPAPHAPQTKPDAPQTKQTAPTLTDADRWELIEKMTDERRSPTKDAGRNGRLLFLAQLAHDQGESEADILAYCLQFIEKDFTEAEIKATVASAVKRTSAKYTPEQLANYKAKREKEPKEPKPKNVDPGEKIRSYEQGGDAYAKIIAYLNDKHEFRTDIVSNELETKKKGGQNWAELNENDILHELRQVPIKVSDAVLTSLLGSNFVARFDPFKTYFEGLDAYDSSEGDHIKKLSSFVKLKDEKERDFFDAMFQKTLVRVAAAATLRISFNKQALILGGCQNGGKSTLVRFLCPPTLAKYRVDWSRDEMASKDGRFALAQNFLINLDEMASFQKADIAAAKALMSLDHIKDRLPYGKRPTRFPRRASFFGSTNKDEFLTDETGTVRWLVFEVESIQHDNGGPEGYAAKVSIDRVWAQAWHLLTTGEVLPEMTKNEVEHSEAKNKAFAVTTTEMETLLRYYEEAGKNELGVSFCTTSQILTDITCITGLKLSVNGLGAAIKRLGWKPESKRTNGGHPVKGYFVRKLDIPGTVAQDIEGAISQDIENQGNNELPFKI